MKTIVEVLLLRVTLSVILHWNLFASYSNFPTISVFTTILAIFECVCGYNPDSFSIEYPP